MPIMFGPSGNSDLFYEQGHKSSLEMPIWLKNQGLDAYEYNCTKGVKINQKSAEQLGQNAIENGIFLSIHAQYYISLSSVDEEKRDASVVYIIESLNCARWMGAKRVVVHSGSCGKMSRSDALGLAKNTLLQTLAKATELDLGDIHICPETMGKINQLGTLTEVIELCKIDERLIPTIDFGHINAREMGNLRTSADFEAIINQLISGLGIDRIKSFHCHFSKIEYTIGGEKRHLTFADDTYGPSFEPLAEVLYKKSLTPVIICESAGNMAEDALIMKKMYMKETGVE